MLQPKDKHWLNGYKTKTHIYAVYKKPTSDLKTHMTERERMEKHILCKLKATESWSSNSYIKVELKEYHKR